MSEIENLHDELKRKFNSEETANKNLTFQFELADFDNFYIIINDGSFELKQGDAQETDLVLISDKETLLNIIRGKMSGMQALMSGKLKAEGNMMLAGQLSKFFSN